MNETRSAEPRSSDSEDAAWVTIDTPFGASELRLFLDDVERLYRINSYLVFEEWRQTGANQFRLKAKNQSNGRTVETDLDVEAIDDGILVRYSDGLKSSTSFRVRAQAPNLANLIVTDDYSGTPVDQREARIDEVDRSLAHWGKGLHRYLKQWKRWSWLPGWQYYMRRVWQPMKPMARRIVFLLIAITAAEFVVFLFIFAIFWLELGKYIG
ncbi:MAG: hypothetical protein QGH73_13595 [Rhodospirillales bacterium]|jgi:hypothetical protein|nr:hypothetical protein [Rhodospirillaceae bacterium]MDP6430611.1 hypothetical protein [Rhodospirillales bacterium]MDP6644070.1 hypothetical protein [Rhodospirillales bacterium]MDP6842702.1 hypothetical protein [Rhodospirillales bacterium]|tara:strand:+ start:1712 stop:2344 length:633 start_codon:yes stop_codon:yes gene_type:complete